MKTLLRLGLRRLGKLPKAILSVMCLLGLGAWAAVPYLETGWSTSGAVVGDYIEGSFTAYDSDGDLTYMEVDLYNPSGQLVNYASGVYDPYYSGYTIGITTWESGQWYVVGRACDAQGHYVEGYQPIWVDNPPPPYP